MNNSLHRVRASAIASVLGFALFALACFSSNGAIMYGTFTNYLGVADTNQFLLYPIVGTMDQSGNPIANADGSFVVGGLPRRITPNGSGYWETNVAVGNYLASNKFLGRGIAFRAPNDWSPVNKYALVSNLISGYNVFVTIVFGTNPAPTSVQITNALGFLPLTPVQSTNVSAGVVPTNLWSSIVSQFISNLVYFGSLQTNSLVAGSSITLTTNSGVITIASNGQTNSLVAGSNITLTTNAGVITIASTASGVGATNAVAAGTLVTVATNGTLYTVAAFSQTNGFTDMVKSNVTVYIHTNALPALTNQFATTNFAQSMTNGMTSLATTNPSAVFYTNGLPALTNTFALTNDGRVLNLSNTLSVYAGKLTNGINVGNAFSSPGTNTHSEQFGSTASATGSGSTALGFNASVSGDLSTAIGNGSSVTSTRSIAIGNGTVISGSNSAGGVAIGDGASANGGSSVANGKKSTASGTNSVAIGVQASATNDNVTVIGHNAFSTAANQIVFGTTNEYVIFPGNGVVNGTFTNGQTVLTNLFSDRKLLSEWSTNVLFVTNSGTAGGNGTYLYGSASVYTNTQNSLWTINFQNPTWFMTFNGVNEYSSTAPANTSWSIVSGASPAPISGYGANIYLAGLNFIGSISSTDLVSRLTLASNYADLKLQAATNYSDAQLRGATNYSDAQLRAATNFSIVQLQAATNYTLTASNNLQVAINRLPTNAIAPGTNIVFTTNSGIISINSTAGGVGAGGIATNAGTGIGNTFSNVTLRSTTVISNLNMSGYAVSNADAFYSGLNASFYGYAYNSGNIRAPASQANFGAMIGGLGNQQASVNGNAAYSALIGGLQNSIGNEGTGSYSVIDGGLENSIGSSGANAIYDAILSGQGNVLGSGSAISQQDAILAGENNSIGNGSGNTSDNSIISGSGNAILNAAQSAIISGTSNLIKNSSQAMVFGANNAVSNANYSVAGGKLAQATNANVFVWSDGTTFKSKTNNQFIVYATNGVAINTNYSGTNALEVFGNIDSTVGFTINGVPVGNASTANLLATNDVRNASLTGTIFTSNQTNQTFSTTNFAVGLNPAIWGSTNVLVIEGAGPGASSVKANDTYQWDSSIKLYTNSFTGYSVTNVAGIWYLNTASVVTLYSSAALQTNAWTQVGGGGTLPNSQFGGYISHRGLVSLYDIQSTNLYWQITNYSQRIATNASSVTDGMVATATGKDFKLVTLGTALTNSFVPLAGGVMTGPLTNNSGVYGNLNGASVTGLLPEGVTTEHGIADLAWRGFSTFGPSAINGGATTQGIVLNLVSNAINSPMFSWGYNVVLITDGWWAGRNPTTGRLMEYTNNFPMGISNMIYSMHTNGFKAFLYYDDKTFGGASGPIIAQFPNGVTSQVASNDCLTFKEWGADGMVWDDRLFGGQDYMRGNIEQWSHWMKTINPNMLFQTYGSGGTNIVNASSAGDWDWLATVPLNVSVPLLYGYPVTNGSIMPGTGGGFIMSAAHKLWNWRVNASDVFGYFFDPTGGDEFDSTIIPNIAWAHQAAPYVRPGKTLQMTGFQDSDTPWDITSSVGAGFGKSATTFWALFHSPFQPSGNQRVYPSTMYFLTNAYALGIQRDALMNPPQMIWNKGDGIYAWSEQLSGGRTAIAFIANTNAFGSTQTFSFPLALAGIPTNKTVQVIDVWNNTSIFTNNTIGISITNKDTQLLIISTPDANSFVTAGGPNTEWFTMSDVSYGNNFSRLGPDNISATPFFSRDGISLVGSLTGNMAFQFPGWTTNVTIYLNIQSDAAAPVTWTNTTTVYGEDLNGRASGDGLNQSPEKVITVPSGKMAQVSWSLNFNTGFTNKYVSMAWGACTNTGVHRVLSGRVRADYK